MISVKLLVLATLITGTVATIAYFLMDLINSGIADTLDGLPL